jgi:hypothetical protein
MQKEGIPLLKERKQMPWMAKFTGSVTLGVLAMLPSSKIMERDSYDPTLPNDTTGQNNILEEGVIKIVTSYAEIVHESIKTEYLEAINNVLEDITESDKTLKNDEVIVQAKLTSTHEPDRIDCEEIRDTDYRSPEERKYFLAECIIEPETEVTIIPETQSSETNSIPEILVQEQSPKTLTGEMVLAHTTEYYCEQVPGAPIIGDGGGWCGTTASGQPVGPGVAACSYNWELGTRLYIEEYNEEVTCLDRGLGEAPWVDIWRENNSQLRLIPYSNVTVVE